MKRKIIRIDEDKCNGCGNCIPNCPEGALQIIDGKARLISDLFCDGLGACLGNCPLGAISVEEREAEEYNEYRVMDNIVKGGRNVITAHLKHLKDHNQTEFYHQAIDYLKEKGMEIPPEEDKTVKEETHKGCPSCPGSRSISITFEEDNQNENKSKIGDKKENPDEVQEIPRQSYLRNWPIQLGLMNPDAEYFKGAHLLIASDCSGFSHPDFHREFLQGKILLMFCPKLDFALNLYVEKLTHIFKTKNIQSITILNMEVPCCFGTDKIVRMALQESGKNIPINKFVLSMKGEIIEGN